MDRTGKTILESVRDRFGCDIQIKRRIPVSGGDTNSAFRLELSDGRTVFLKTNSVHLEDMFQAEMDGLCALASSGVIPVTRPLATGTDPDRNCSYLLLEFETQGKPGRTFWEDFGRSLAMLHRQRTEEYVTGGTFGFFRNNYIGRMPQSNAAHNSWVAFFREERLLPQFGMAERWFDGRDRARIERLTERLDEYLLEPAFPSLLHGDLWGGNFIADAGGRAMLIDPAVYVGCDEADLAMTELFGGFSPRFYEGYREVSPQANGYEERRDLYNLYHLLNHLNLFGSAYLQSVLGIIRRFG